MVRFAWTLPFLCILAVDGGAAASGGRQATPSESLPSRKLIGYFDANSQLELPAASVPHPNLTHVVLTNALKVDNQGNLHYRSKKHPSELDAAGLIRHFASLPVRLVVSLRGHEDDVALDELAEVNSVRETFATNMAALLREWNADGLEIEWHSDDPAGGKAVAAPFDVMEQYHFALLCRDLSGALRAAGGKTLSVAVRPGRREFNNSAFVQHYIDWLALRAYSMRSLGDPHHSSLKDMATALGEWTEKGVPQGQLVLGTPLFARPGAALSTANDRNEALRLSWKELSRSHLHKAPHGDRRGDVFTDVRTGKTWWLSGLNTTRAKVRHVLEAGFGGVALRDLHLDGEGALSLVRAAADALREVPRQRLRLTRPMSLFQRGVRRSRGEAVGKQEEL